MPLHCRHCHLRCQVGLVSLVNRDLEKFVVSHLHLDYLESVFLSSFLQLIKIENVFIYFKLLFWLTISSSHFQSKINKLYDLIYYVNSTEPSFHDNYLGETGRRIIKRVEDHSGRDHALLIVK